MDNEQTINTIIGSHRDVVLQKSVENFWTAKKTNDEVLNQACTQRNLIKRIRIRQSKFFGHIAKRRFRTFGDYR